MLHLRTAIIESGLSSTYAEVTTAEKYVFASFIGITIFGSIELVVLCFITFKRYSGLYFWSLLVASISLVPQALGFTFILYRIGVSEYLSTALTVFSWYAMVTGQALVLYSRLHLVCHNKKICDGVLWMIIIDAICLHVPTTILIFGSASSDANLFVSAYGIMEHIQIMGFALQESIISGVYIWEVARLLRIRPQRSHVTVLKQLLCINILILMVDIAVVSVEYEGYWAIQVVIKPFSYSVKLKLEYAVLSRLVIVAQGSSALSGPSRAVADVEQPTFSPHENCGPVLEDSSCYSSRDTSILRPK
ncbi:hypothetical protein N7481_010455 [Penicillium waksmanii]|uniref:uncharacterized protein n=1 Tax=Penicillium waksmanii TaxID=69791 RepID=UPI0025475E24|nr:uncharacterized protein N7481_010455 [Penicillium waksmanii]KAJ5973245.1 hypothetical protein N7481_010455 [Penicillium waksmanii]